VADAVLAYLRRDRPRCSDREIFFTAAAPIVPLKPQGVSYTFRQRVRVSDIIITVHEKVASSLPWNAKINGQSAVGQKRQVIDSSKNPLFAGIGTIASHHERRLEPLKNGAVGPDLGVTYAPWQRREKRMRMLVTLQFADAGTKSGIHRVLIIGRSADNLQTGDIGLSLDEAKSLISAIPYEFVSVDILPIEPRTVRFTIAKTF
jgi:hypothetical protein